MKVSEVSGEMRVAEVESRHNIQLHCFKELIENEIQLFNIYLFGISFFLSIKSGYIENRTL